MFNRKPKHRCGVCGHPGIDKGRAWDGRRAYHCQKCGEIWTESMQSRQKRIIQQRFPYQFANSRKKRKGKRG